MVQGSSFGLFCIDVRYREIMYVIQGVFAMVSYGVAIVLLWFCHGVATVLLWACHGFAMELLGALARLVKNWILAAL